MKCPKCHYLGLDSGPRCRHCGYEFSLADLAGEPEAGSHLEPGPRTGGGRKTPASPRSRHDRPSPTPGAGIERPLARVPDSGPLDLPLFPDDGTGVPHFPPPRPPLAVRRSTPTPARVRPQAPHQDAEAYDLGLEPPQPPVPQEMASAGPHETSREAALPVSGAAAAPPLRRLLAAGTDLALLGAIDATVVYFTLRVCELSFSQMSVLPPVPLASFFAILNGGYLVLFTGVFGQTLGKMLFGIEVVASDMTPVDLGRALYRAIVSLLSVLTAGLGFLPALVGEGRSLHDRLAGTRVVLARASHTQA